VRIRRTDINLPTKIHRNPLLRSVSFLVAVLILLSLNSSESQEIRVPTLQTHQQPGISNLSGFAFSPPAIEHPGGSVAEKDYSDQYLLQITNANLVAQEMNRTQLPFSNLPASPQRKFQVQIVSQPEMISNGQFVWGPNVGDFDLFDYLEQRNSPLSEYAHDVLQWAVYGSINPKVLLTAIEVRWGWVTSIDPSVEPEFIRSEIESIALDMALNFYDHLYTWGERAEPGEADQPPPALIFVDEQAAQFSEELSSGSFAIASAMARGNDLPTWQLATAESAAASFPTLAALLFPETNFLDTSNFITPDQLPPDDFFQLPFPLGAEWTFNGPHSWHGGSAPPPFSSMDFTSTWAACSASPEDYSVAATDGSSISFAPNPVYSDDSCWVHINHPDGWTTSYYHLLNVQSTGTIGRNERVGSVGCEICNGGFSSGSHVHFTLLYNGAYVSLEGVKFSDWTVHVGSTAYSSGYLERDGVILNPYARVANDYHERFGEEANSAIRFSGETAPSADRVIIPIDDPLNDLNGPPADLGFHDFVLEWWMKATPGENNAPAVTCGVNQNWKNGNVLFDRSHSQGGNEWGVSIAGGKIAVGISSAANGDLTLCSETSVDDGEWHHITIQRNRWDATNLAYLDGQIWLFIDGVLQSSVVGPGGDISHPNSTLPGNTCGPSGTDTCQDIDPFLYIGGGKSDGQASFSGTIDEVRLSWWLRYFDEFSPTQEEHAQDSSTVGLYRFDEGSGIVAFDTGGYDRGTGNAEVLFNALSTAPEWILSDLGAPSQSYSIFIPIVSR
jgi:hypothetical protein